MPRTSTIHAAMILTALGCGSSNEPSAPATTTRASREAPTPAEVGRFELHEWGLFAATTGDAPVIASTGVHPSATSGFGLGGLGHHGGGVSGGKPVIYVHLDEGVQSAELTLWIEGDESTRFLEAWPSGTHTAHRLAFVDLAATRGRCAAPTSPPDAASVACTGVTDGFCEAAEISRYHGDDDVCLRHGDVASELLFYRADGMRASSLPIRLVIEGGALAIRRMQPTPVTGPILVVARDEAQQVTIRRLDSNDASGRIDSLPGTVISKDEARAALLAHARSGGLTEREADAFIDAWSEAFFDTARREGPTASGQPPLALRPSDSSLLYFAPRATIDRLLPLRSTPAARSTSRVFLVRTVDAARTSIADSFASLGRGLGGSPSSRVVVERPTAVRGALAPDMIRRVIQRNVSQIRRCYDLALLEDATKRGRIELRLSIRADGTVERTEIGRSTLRDRAFETCVATAGRRWAFPTGEAPTSATVPYVLSIDEPSR